MIRVIIPVYNEEKNIENCVAQVSNALGKRNHRFYIINDGSEDQSSLILRKIARKYPVKIINHKMNQGIAAVIRSGLSRVLKEGRIGDVVVVIEGDGTSDCGLLGRMINKIERGQDVMIASRYFSGGAYKRFPFKRLVLSKSANFIFRIIFPSISVSDYTIFYRAYSYGVLKKVSQVYRDRLITTQYFVANTELLINIMSITNNIGEVPLVYDYGYKKGKSSLNVRKNLIEYWKFVANSKLFRVLYS